MADNRVEFELAMKDEATRVLNNFKANVNTQSKAVQDAFRGMQGATANSTNALMNFNRVIQDAPYGIMGVANNINPLVESFQRLSKESGGVKGAIMAMVGGIASPAGIGIAVAAVSSLAVAFGDKLIPRVDETKRKTKEAEEAMKSYAEMMSRVVADMKVLDEQMGAARQSVIQKELEMVQGRLSVYRQLETQIKNGSREIVLSEEEAARVGIHADELLKFSKQQLSDEIKRLSDRAVELNTMLISLGMTIESTVPKYEAGKKPLSTMRMELNGLVQSAQNAKKEFASFKIEIPQQTLDMFASVREGFLEMERSVIIASQGMAMGMQQAFANSEPLLKGVLKSTLNAIITAVEAQIIAAKASSIAQGIISGGTTLFRDVPALIAAVSALEMGRSVINKMHNGGTVGNFQNQPASREFPIMVRGGETVRTEGQERDLQNKMGGRGNGGVININFNSPVSDAQFTVNSLKRALRETGITIDRLAVNQRSKVVLT